MLEHDFIAKSQAEYLTDIKDKLGKCFMLSFFENYTCRVQNSLQFEYWNTAQATIHPYVVYYKESDVVKHKSFVIISEHLDHDSSALCNVIFIKE